MNYEILCLSCVYLILIAEVFIRFLNGYGTVNKTRVQTDADTMRKRERARLSNDSLSRETHGSCAESRSKLQSSLTGKRKSGANSNFPSFFSVSKQYDTLPHRKHHQWSYRNETEGGKRRFKREINRKKMLIREGRKAGKEGINDETEEWKKWRNRKENTCKCRNRRFLFFKMYQIEGYIDLTETYRLLNISRAILGSSWGVLSGC